MDDNTKKEEMRAKNGLDNEDENSGNILQGISAPTTRTATKTIEAAARNAAVSCHVVDAAIAVRETDGKAAAIEVEGPCLTAVVVGKNHVASAHMEGLKPAAERVASPLMKTSEIKDITATISQRKSAKNAVGQPRNAAARIEDIVAPQSSIDDHGVSTFLAHVDSTLSAVGVHNSITFGTSQTISNSVLQCHHVGVPIDSKVDDARLNLQNIFLLFPPPSKSWRKLRNKLLKHDSRHKAPLLHNHLEPLLT
ncbi:hypothetical protein ACH5RR_001559 [Cinchona calisaya]|uniref:Uncharacterized protein n=1 Tax=Cinchona calisaya TaxID=153742 RepID=A0ABD3B3V2_9GENT